MAEPTKRSTEKELAGVLGFFDTPDELVEATRKLRDSDFESFDAFTPYPIHGLDTVQGLRPSFLPFVTLGGGLTGLACGFLLEYWTSAVSWPMNVGGKPPFSWPAFVPVLFETTVLFAGIATFIGMLLVNRLPNKKRSFDPSLTNNRFALLIEAPVVKKADEDEDEEPVAFDEGRATEFLKGIGAQETRKVYEEGWF